VKLGNFNVSAVGSGTRVNVDYVAQRFTFAVQWIDRDAGQTRSASQPTIQQGQVDASGARYKQRVYLHRAFVGPNTYWLNGKMRYLVRSWNSNPGEIRPVVGWRSWMPHKLQGALDELGATISPIANIMSYNLIIGHRVSPAHADPGIGRDYVYLNEYQKGGRLVTLAITLGGVIAPEIWGTRALAAGPGTARTYTVYQSLTEAGDVQYVGITSNLEARAAAHYAEKGIDIQRIQGLTDLSLSDARAVEQTLIETYGLGKNGGSLLNKINSISPTADTPYYLDSLFRGQELLDGVGYFGP